MSAQCQIKTQSASCAGGVGRFSGLEWKHAPHALELDAMEVNFSAGHATDVMVKEKSSTKEPKRVVTAVGPGRSFHFDDNHSESTKRVTKTHICFSQTHGRRCHRTQLCVVASLLA